MGPSRPRCRHRRRRPGPSRRLPRRGRWRNARGARGAKPVPDGKSPRRVDPSTAGAAPPREGRSPSSPKKSSSSFRRARRRDGPARTAGGTVRRSRAWTTRPPRISREASTSPRRSESRGEPTAPASRRRIDLALITERDENSCPILPSCHRPRCGSCGDAHRGVARGKFRRAAVWNQSR